MIQVQQPYALETRALQTRFEHVHQDVFGGFWLRRLLPMPGLVRQGDFLEQAASLRTIEDRLRLIRLACMASSGTVADTTAALRLSTYADTLHAAITALRRILERLHYRSEGRRYDMDEFAADVERYHALVEAHRNITLPV